VRDADNGSDGGYYAHAEQGRATAAAPATPGAVLAQCRGRVEACVAARVAGELGQLSAK
jgi:hypothetical protein